MLEQRLARAAEVTLPSPARPAWAEAVLERSAEAGRALDRIFWEQSCPGGWDMRARLQASGGAWSRTATALMRFHAGPFDRFRGREPFLDVGPRPPGGGLWPPFATRGEIAGMVARHPELAEGILAPRTVVRERDGQPEVLPFAEAYAGWLALAAGHLREAVSLARDDDTADYLMRCADAIETGGGCRLPPEAGGLAAVLGPYDPGEDRLLRRKAAYVAMLGWIDPEETRRLDPFLAAREALIRYLPDTLELPEDVPPAVLVVADEFYRGGGAAHGLQPVAWTRRTAEGSYSVLWRDRIEARREVILEPLSSLVLDVDQRPLLTPEGYFQLILMRELGRGLVPPPEVAPGDPEVGAVLAEARAGAVGRHSMEWFLRRGVLPASLGREHHTALLMELLATIRAGEDSVPGRAALIALNWHREQGGILHDPDTGRFRVVPDRMLDSETALAGALLAAETSETGAEELLAAYGHAGSEVRGMLARTADLPVAIRVPDGQR
ncbi:MAG: hypothetical protein PVF68_08060 [Acidobacteriota bacterium]